jgi:hypothetical protein
VRSDEYNCGQCGNACDPGERCDQGQCKCTDATGGGTDCDAPLRCCPGKGCALNDNNNCGLACDTCIPPESCNLDHCEKLCSITCPPGFLCKDDTCYCAADGNKCNPGGTCCETGCADQNDKYCPTYSAQGCTFEDCTANIFESHCCPDGVGCSAIKGLCPILF